MSIGQRRKVRNDDLDRSSEKAVQVPFIIERESQLLTPLPSEVKVVISVENPTLYTRRVAGVDTGEGINGWFPRDLSNKLFTYNSGVLTITSRSATGLALTTLEGLRLDLTQLTGRIEELERLRRQTTNLVPDSTNNNNEIPVNATYASLDQVLAGILTEEGRVDNAAVTPYTLQKKINDQLKVDPTESARGMPILATQTKPKQALILLRL